MRAVQATYRTPQIVLAVFMALCVTACGESPETEASEAPQATAETPFVDGQTPPAEDPPASSPATDGDRMARIVPEGDAQNFPRQFKGYRLLDPAPEGSKDVEKGPLRAGKMYEQILDSNSKKIVRVYSYQGRISRIQYVELDAQPVEPYFEEAKKRFGEPSTDMSWQVYFSSGMGNREGDTGVRIGKEGKTTVTSFIEDMNLAITTYNAS